jgi:hypothetical protein
MRADAIAISKVDIRGMRKFSEFETLHYGWARRTHTAGHPFSPLQIGRRHARVLRLFSVS